METKQRSGDFGISAGIIAGALVIAVQIIIDFVLVAGSQSDPLLWILRIILYFVVGLIAANTQYGNQPESDESSTGVSNAGRGSAMIICVCAWVYLIIRSLAMDDPGMFFGLGIFPSVCLSLVDFFIAVALGSLAGRIIENQHKYQEVE